MENRWPTRGRTICGYYYKVGRLLVQWGYEMGLIGRVLLIAGGLIASWFVARDALNFPIVSFVVAMFLLVGLVALLAFWRTIVQGLRELLGIGKPK